MKWRSAVVREALTLERLDTLEPREAAAWFIMRRADGLTSSEQTLLTDWLSKDESHRSVFDSADRAWESFSDSEGDEILAAMRAHALATPSRGSRFWLRPALAAAAVLLLAVGGTLFWAPGISPFGVRPGPQGGAPDMTVEYSAARGG